MEGKHTYHGIVSCVLGQVDGEILEIENWVMSCRVFSRTLEEFIVSKLLNAPQAIKCSGSEPISARSKTNPNKILPRLDSPGIMGLKFWKLDYKNGIKTFVCE